MNELKPCPMCGGAPNKPAKNGGSDERSGYNFTITVACKCGLRIDRASHQGKQGWCDDSGQAEAEAIAAWNRRAQPAAPAILMSAVFVKEGADDFAPQRLLPCGSAVYLVPPDAAPSVAPEPLFLLHSGQIDSGGEQDDWETEADSQVRVDEFCRLHPGQTIPLFAHPPRAPLTEEQVTEVYEVSSGQPLRPQDKESVFAFAYAIEAAHGIGGK